MNLEESPEGSFGREPDKSGINFSSSEDVREVAERARESIIKGASRAVKFFWKEDQKFHEELKAIGYPKGSVISYFVLEDYFSVTPEESPDRIRTLSIKLIPDEQSEFDYSETMGIYIPIPDDVNLHDERFDIDEIPEPSAVYIKRKWMDGKVEGYRISGHEVTTYFGIDDPTTDLLEAHDFEAQMWARFSKRVDSGLPVIGRLQEDMVNMKTIKQRFIPTDNPETFDF